MGKADTAELERFLQPFTGEITSVALWLRGFVWDQYPGCNELIYDNYNAVAFGWSTTDRLKDTFCSIAAFPDYAHFGFYWGNKISDPEKRLSGKGNQYRYLKVSDIKEFPKTYIKKLLREAYINSLAGIPGQQQSLKGATIVKSISARKKRPA